MVGCLEPFDPKIPDSETGFLVIDGIITDQPGPYTVSISNSSGLDGESEPVTGITDILIEAGSGISENLTESSDGIYQTGSLLGVVGESYRLRFTHEGQQYQSSMETILPSPIIDSIYFQEETRGTTSLSVDLEGLEFFINAHGENNKVQYFRYEWEETWKFAAPVAIQFDYIGNDSIELKSEPPIDICWKHRNSTGINIATTEDLTESILSGHSLGFMSGEQRFTIRYSLLTRQFAIQEKEYTFWKSLKESNEELGSLFDRQPGKVFGNIGNIDNPGETVLGYFSASGLREERLYIDDTEVSDPLRAGLVCLEAEFLLKGELGTRYEEALLDRLADGALFFDFIFREGFPVPIGAIVVAPSCADCTLNGGVLEAPEFWIE